MIIKFSCKKHCLDFTKIEEELTQQKVITRCPYCGEKLSVTNLTEIIDEDCKKKGEEYLNKWFNELGIEGTIEMIFRSRENKITDIYKDLLKKKGLIK